MADEVQQQKSGLTVQVSGQNGLVCLLVRGPSGWAEFSLSPDEAMSFAASVFFVAEAEGRGAQQDGEGRLS